MSDMLREVSNATASSPPVNIDALRSEIRAALINQKANACPIAVRLAWHASGTWDRQSQTGGSNGATMRFSPEATDPDNAGLGIVRDLLLPIKLNHPEVSYADLYALAGVCAVEFLGGPRVPVFFGRKDDSNNSRCPANGRLPDAKKGAKHLRQLFGERMGFTDREIVALSGAHTLGRCHAARSGFDGPWTTKPLQFDNEYYTNLLHRTWKLREWEGPLQYEDVESGELMMLPSDLCLIEDATFKKVVEEYAADEKLFFREFAEAYSKLLALGCPPCCDPKQNKPRQESEKERVEAVFRESAMHGSVFLTKKIIVDAKKSNVTLNVRSLEATSGRNALHKAAFWGHNQMMSFLLQSELKQDVNVQDCNGDTPLHDAAKFGHADVVGMLVAAGAKINIKNKAGLTPVCLAKRHGKEAVLAKLGSKL